MSTTDLTRGPKRTRIESLGRGLGSLWQTRDGRYFHIYTDQATGKQHEQRLAADNLTKARKEIAGRVSRAERGELAPPTTITFADVAEEYLEMFAGLVASGERKPRTLELYRQRYESHLKPRLGRLRFQQITTHSLSDLLAIMRRAGLSPNTMSGVVMLAGSIFRFGVTRRYRADDPSTRLTRSERPKPKPRSKPRTLTDEECSRLIASARPAVRDFVAFAAFTGVRQSEGLGVTWGDLDLEAGTVTVTVQLGRWKKGETPQRTALKTENSRRVIDLHPELVMLLRGRKKQALTRGLHRNDHFVFCTDDGNPLIQRNVSRDIRIAGDKAGLNPIGAEPVGCHDLRHTFISRLISLGLDVVEVARQAGDTPKTILDVYAHEFSRAKRRDEIKNRIATGTTIVLG